MVFAARIKAAIGLVAVATVLGATTPKSALATMLQRMSFEEVTHEAGRIVYGKVIEVRSDRDESRLPATWITLSVTRTLKGPHTPELTFKQYGVASPLADGTITRVAGLPVYHVGEEVVLFLRNDSRRGFTSPVGFSQGTYRVINTGAKPHVRRDLDSASTQSLDDFCSEITRITAAVP